MAKIKIYTAPGCPYCHLAKEFFKERGLEFEEIDVSQDERAAKEMIEKSGQMGVPVIEIDEEIIVGFDLPKIKEVLDLND